LRARVCPRLCPFVTQRFFTIEQAVRATSRPCCPPMAAFPNRNSCPA